MRRPAAVVATLGLLCVLHAVCVDASSNTVSGDDAATAAKYNDQALEHGNAGKLLKAMKLHHKSIQYNPLNPEYKTNMGVTQWRLGRLQHAFETFVSVVEAHPAFDNAWLNLKELWAAMKADGAATAAQQQQYAWIDDHADVPKPTAKPTTKPSGAAPRAPIGTGIRHHVEPLPRLTLEDLASGVGQEYRTGRKPFMVTGLHEHPAWANSTALRRWDFDYFAQELPEITVDFYPHNMGIETVKPFFLPMHAAVQEVRNPSGRYPTTPENPGAYLQWNVMVTEWHRVLGELGPLPAPFVDAGVWLPSCMDTEALQDSFSRTTHWHMVLLGNQHAGMFNHWDIMGTASWQVQVVGEKKWHLCSPDYASNMGGAGSVHVFNPDYDAAPDMLHARCFLDTVKAGEMVYYPSNWWHQTENLSDENIAASGSVVDHNNWPEVAAQMEQDCSEPAPRFRFTPEARHNAMPVTE